MNVQPSAHISLPRGGARRSWIPTIIHFLIILSVVAGFLVLWWVDSLPKRVDEQQTVVVGPAYLVPDSTASVRVVVQDFAAGRPLTNARVKVSLKPEKGRAIPLFEGRTDASGSLPVQFHVPADAPAKASLVVETQSPAGKDRVERAVAVQRPYRLLLTSDKPLYQPGQVIHMRALALSALDLAPARGMTFHFLVEDPKGNKVFRKDVPASEWGIAAVDFTLADLVNQGNYKLSVSVGEGESETRSEKTVEVRPYVLPKFAVSISTDRTFYLPGQRVEGIVQADYFFGKPVAGGQVQLVGSVWDVERTVLLDLHGETDENGAYRFGFDLPDYLAGAGLDTGQGQVALEVTVIDQAEHAEQASQVLPVAAQPLIIEAVAESGVLKPGVENVVYVLTSYPDGRPAPAKLQVHQDYNLPIELETGEYGLAEFAFTPQPGQAHILNIVAQDKAGLSASRRFELQIDSGADHVLLRADRAAYVVGETMNLVAFTPVESGSIYLDIVKAGQTLSTRSAMVEGGKVEFAVDVSPDLYGSLELHAYKVLLDGTIVRDTRLVVVDAPNEVSIAVTTDQDIYLPGETAAVAFQTGPSSDSSSAVQTTLGIAIVDESVFALQRQDPGFAKLYFMLEQELMEPFYQVKGFELPASLPPTEEDIRPLQDKAATAAWSGAARAAVVQPVNSRPLKVKAVQRARAAGLGHIANAALIGLIAIPLLLCAAALVAVGRAKLIKRALVRLLVAGGVMFFVAICLAGWLIAAANEFYYLDPEDLLVPFFAIMGLGLLAFFIYAWVRRDMAAKFLALLTLAWAALVFLLILAADRGDTPNEVLGIVALLVCLLIPVAYVLFGQGRWVQSRRFVGILSTGMGGMLALPLFVILPLALVSVGSTFASTADLRGRGMPLAEMGKAPMATVTVERMVEAEKSTRTDVDTQPATAAEPPRLRQYFPETLYWAPEVLTDENGKAALEIPMADSITTWRLTALASTQDGRLGFTTHGIRVFQDFFVDIDLPVALTQGDEISIPVGVFNYLPEAQQVRLVAQPEPWFELLGQAEQTLTIASNEVEVVYFPIRVKQFGQQGFQVTAWGSRMSDAIRRQVRVMPDGKEIRSSESDWLREPKEIVLDIPADAVPDTARVEVKIYPGVMAQVLEGLEKILRLPHG